MNDLCTSMTEKGSFFYFSGYIQMLCVIFA